MDVNNKRLEVAATTSGHTTNDVPPSRQDDCGRLLATTSGSTYTNHHQLIYVSFIANFTNLPAAQRRLFCDVQIWRRKFLFF